MRKFPAGEGLAIEEKEDLDSGFGRYPETFLVFMKCIQWLCSLLLDLHISFTSPHGLFST